MAENMVEVAAPPEAVWSVLADPHTYGEWVVGTSETSTGEGLWPEVGASLEYTVGVGPLEIGDRTVVLESDEPRLLVLEARMIHGGAFGIRLELEPTPGGTRVTMVEQ